MSNGVHVAKVSKIQRGLPKAVTLGRRKDTQTDEKDMTDLSPDQTHSDNNISSCSTLDIMNLTQQQLENQVRDLVKRLQKSEDDRNSLKNQLQESNTEKDVCLRRLEVITTAHECRITEMHCVIAELSKKLRAKQENVILEEHEEGSEASYQEGSIYNSELNLTNPEAECQTDPLDSIGDDEACLAERNQIDYFTAEINEHDIKLNETANKGQIEALQEEVLHLKAQIALLQSEIANSVQPEKALVNENQSALLEYYDDANESNCSSERLLFVQSDSISATPQQIINTAAQQQYEDVRMPKMAERVKLRCVSSKDKVNLDDYHCKEIPNVDLMKHLASNLKEHSNCMLDELDDSTQLDNELLRYQRRFEHTKMQNTVLTLTLEECKEHCEHLYLLCGKYESNAIALQLALNCSDRAIEAYDVMLALLESKLALMKERSAATEESRKAVESVARHLLDRLECEKNLCETSLGPWQSTFNIPEKVTTPWTADDDNRLRYHVSKLKGRRSTVQNTIVNLESPFSDYYEKARMASLESGSELKNQERAAYMDLEMAVLMQELLNLREENITLKTQMEDLHKERQLTLNRISILEDALNQLQLQLNTADTHNAALFQHRESSCNVALENRISYSEAEHAAVVEQQLVEALTRETELKGRIQTLIASVAASHKVSEAKCEHFQNKTRELDSNLNMNTILEQNKRKYQTRIRKLEQKLLELTVHSDHSNAAATADQRAACSTKPLIHQHDNVPETTL